MHGLPSRILKPALGGLSIYVIDYSFGQNRLELAENVGDMNTTRLHLGQVPSGISPVRSPVVSVLADRSRVRLLFGERARPCHFESVRTSG